MSYTIVVYRMFQYPLVGSRVEKYYAIGSSHSGIGTSFQYPLVGSRVEKERIAVLSKPTNRKFQYPLVGSRVEKLGCTAAPSSEHAHIKFQYPLVGSRVEKLLATKITAASALPSFSIR